MKLDGSKTNYNPRSAGKTRMSRHRGNKHSRSQIEKEEKFEEKIKEIVQRHQTYYLQPVKVEETAESNEIATDVSVILDENDNEALIWDYVDEEDQKKVEEDTKKKEQRMRESKRLVEEIKALRMVRHLSESQVKRTSLFSDQGEFLL